MKKEKLRYKMFSSPDLLQEWANSDVGTDYIISIVFHDATWFIYYIS